MDTLEKSILYRNAEDYSLALDTYFVESFDNVLNIFHDRRISFGTKQYRLRSDLALLHWNENVDRPYTSDFGCLREYTRVIRKVKISESDSCDRHSAA